MSPISKSILAEAKAFLCWDVFPDVSIQLVPQQKAAAYYFPPMADVHTIILFYDPAQQDLSEALFLLFHEAGHKKQQDHSKDVFNQMMSMPNGMKRQEFEREAWQFARHLFREFIERSALDVSLLPEFDLFAEKSVQSYAEISVKSKY